jgi:hypothetical protein
MSLRDEQPPSASRRSRTLVVRRPSAPSWTVALVTLVLVVPLVTALIALHRQRWYPLLDLAATEMRVRHVLSAHPPLVGLYGRLGYTIGNHPGPLSFYLLWPAWRAFGRTAFGLQAATATLGVAAVATCVWIASRRGGLRLVLGFGVVLAVVLRAYGAFLLTLPWNPYLPVLWWIVLLLAVWSIVADDPAMLPVAAFAGTMCVQTHVSYLGLVSGLGLVTISVVVYRWRRHGESEIRRRYAQWTIAAAALTIALWIPPLVEQLTHSPGNLSTLYLYFRNPPTSPIGLRHGVDVLASQLDPIRLVTHTLVRDELSHPASGSWLPGALLVFTWAGSVLIATRLHHRLLLQLDVVLGVALALGAISAARIFGDVYYYLLLWAWGLAALLLFAVIWTVAALIWGRTPDAGRTRLRHLSAVGLVAFGLAITALFTNSAAHVRVQAPSVNESLGAIAPPTAHALKQLRADGHGGPYLVTWSPDPERIGAEGYGLVNELERRGLDVRSDIRLGRYVPDASARNVIDPSRAAVEVHVAIGASNIAHWRSDHRYREIVFYDPRTESQRSEFRTLNTQLVAELRKARLVNRIPMIDKNMFMLYVAPNMPARARELLSRMIGLGMPSAVFIGPPRLAPQGA